MNRELTICRRVRAGALAALLALPAGAFAGGVFVAGAGATLEQAFNVALAENPRKSAGAFWVVVSGSEVEGLAQGRASADIRRKLKLARERGGEVFVCRSDLTRAGLMEQDMLDGVVAMYGYGEQDWAGLLPARRQSIVLPEDMKQSQTILKTCAGQPKPGA